MDQDRTQQLVVIGGGAAGMSAASRARRLAPDLAITVLEAGVDVAYGACGLPYLVSGVIHDPQELIAYGPETFRGERRIPFDRLVITAGARA